MSGVCSVRAIVVVVVIIIATRGELLVFVDAKQSDTVKLGQLRQQNHNQGNEIDHKVSRIVLRVHAREQEPA